MKNIRDEEIYSDIKAKISSRLKDWSISVLTQFAAEYKKI